MSGRTPGAATSAATAARLAACMADAGLDWILASSPDVVTYVTGQPVEVETGPSPFAGGPDLALVARDGTVLALGLASEARADAPDVIGYEGVVPTAPVEACAPYTAAVRGLLDRLDVRGVVGVDPRSLPATVASALRDRGAALQDGRRTVDLARAIKSGPELVRVRQAVAAADAGQRALASFLAGSAGGPAGVLPSEIELFGAARAAMERHVGARVAVAGDLLAGTARCAGVQGWPGPARPGRHEPVIADLAPRVAGYWADTAATCAIDPEPALRRMHRAVSAALDAGAAMLRPGTPARDVHQVMTQVLARSGYAFGHHGGHGVGTSVHEFPRIVAGETAPLEAGMVIALEPGAYDEAVGGVRIERMFLIRPDGPDELTTHPTDLVPT